MFEGGSSRSSISKNLTGTGSPNGGPRREGTLRLAPCWLSVKLRVRQGPTLSQTVFVVNTEKNLRRVTNPTESRK